MITQEKINKLMQEAIKESKKSISEDHGVHPKVGAVLSDLNGKILVSSHRGETGNGDHCEYILLKKAEALKINMEETILFVTLEPCTTRGLGKTPCAQRIVESKIPTVYLGMLDPNSVILGRGETYLRKYITVERFPDCLVKEIMETNKDFINKYNSDSLPNSSLYVSKQISNLIEDNLQRSGINISEIPTDWELTIDDVVDYCKANQNTENIKDIYDLVMNARNTAYDQKYSDYTYTKDIRGLSEEWIQEFKNILVTLNMEDISQYSLINVGAGNGLEAKALFNNVEDITLVDIGKISLENAKNLIPGSKIVQNGAENLEDISSESQDVYVSLRTYQSSYFDISQSIKEAYRILRSNGVFIISIANGFIGDDDVLIPGLVIPKTKVVDKNHPFVLSEQIRRKLTLLRFKNVGVRSGIGDIYIYGRRE